MIVLRGGGATDVGRVRSVNEDRYLVGERVFAVADGVGGHQAGEVASQTAVDTLAAEFNTPTVDALVEAVEAANRKVWDLAQEAAEKRGMGTTMTAVAMVDVDGEDQVAIVNVGDSRVYLLQDGELAQVSEDHSLVAELVRQGRLSPADAEIHPQRSIITRALGMEPEIEVDSWTLVPTPGDRLLLCSDGLTNELSDDRIAGILRRLADPADAAGELVRQARSHGGNDNITVVVVDVLDDEAGGGEADKVAEDRGSRAGRAAGAAPTGGGPEARRPAAGEGGGAEPAATTTWGATAVATEVRPPLGQWDTSPARPRRFTWRVAIFLLVVLGVLGATGATVAWYARSAYFVGALDDGTVAIFKGRPGGVLWFEPSLERSTDLTLDDVPASRRDDVRAGKEVPSLAAAERYLANVRAEAESQSASTSVPPALTDTTVQPPPGAPGPTPTSRP